jgi:hypothetical protein
LEAGLIIGDTGYLRLLPQDMSWLVDERGVYLVIDDERYKVQNVAVLANGTLDIAIGEVRGELVLVSLSQPFDGRVLHVPCHDLVVFGFSERLPAPYMCPYLILEIDEALEPLIFELCRRWPMVRREEYDAYLGRDYGRKG